jgi:hypothetical protein
MHLRGLFLVDGELLKGSRRWCRSRRWCSSRGCGGVPSIIVILILILIINILITMVLAILVGELHDELIMKLHHSF